MNAILLLLFSIVPQDHILIDRFDKVELNHFYDDNGRHVYDQVIWYDLIPSRHVVGAWRLVKNPNILPILNRETGLYESVFYDSDVLRKVTAKYMVESWTQFDVELVDREFLKKELRRELSQPYKKKDKPVEVDFNQIWRIFLR